MTTTEFLTKHNASADQIRAEDCLRSLLADMELGLSGKGDLPMLPSFLCCDITIPAGARCCVLDAGGTNLRTALARFEDRGLCRLSQLTQGPMPGTEGPLSHEELYAAMAAPLKALGHYDRVGFCFSYNVSLDRTLDGPLDFWCKEVQAPEAVGKPVGASLKAALGAQCRQVHVLNDSVAVMLGAGDLQDPVQVGIILGTGINVCYLEQCRRITKIEEPLNREEMIISTEIGEFRSIPKSDFDRWVIARSDAPDSAHAEKQCSGGYLGSILNRAWHTAAREELLPPAFLTGRWDLAQISPFLAGDAHTGIPDCPEAARIAEALILRAAKIAAILCAGPMILAAKPDRPLRAVVEGSQYWKLTGFQSHFHRELDGLLSPRGIVWEILPSENACLIGAARAAFAKPM